MNKELLKKAKKMIRDQYGEAFAKKATDEFSLYTYHTLNRPVSRSMEAENLPSGEGQSMVMEFAGQATDKPAETSTRSMASREATELIEKLNENEAITINLQQLLRQARLQNFREKVMKSIQPMGAALERNIERAFAHGTRSLQQQSYLTKVCWLNQTMKTIAGPDSLAEIASDPTIKKLDVPHKLSREINDTGTLVGAIQYRQKFSRTGKGIVVAVIDSEVALNHAAFGNRVLHRSNYTKEPWGNPDSHGTGVAGIIGAATESFNGMAPGATIYNYKVLATNPSLDADDFQAFLAVQKALEDGANLANCSWGAGPAGNGTGREARACNTAWDLGLTIVKSAGNRGPGNGTLTAPADADGIIVVGATNKNGKKMENYSSRGPLPSGQKRPHLVAPGGSSGAGIQSCLPGGGFGDIGMGTSFAAPHVTGLLALLLEGEPSLSPDEQRNFLLSACTKVQGAAIDGQGGGLISLAAL